MLFLVCSVLQRGHSGYECLSSSILFKYECRVGHLFVLSWVEYGGLLWEVLFRNDVR